MLNKGKNSKNISSASELATINKHAAKLSVPSMLFTDNESFVSSTLPSRKYSSIKRTESEHALTNIIDAKVSSLKIKFGELNSLRKKLIGSNAAHQGQGKIETAKKSIIKPNENFICKRNTAILNGVVSLPEESRKKIHENNERYSKIEDKTVYYDQNFDRLLFENESLRSPSEQRYTQPRNLRYDMNSLKTRLEDTENKLKESERLREHQKSLIDQKQKEVDFVQEKYKHLAETNKSLKLQINCLEAKLKTFDEKKSTNTKAIKSLSYIILSKDAVSKESLSKVDTNANNIVLKYLETLNALHNSDQFVVNLFEKMKLNQNKEAFRMIFEMKESLHERLNQTRKDVADLESMVYECRPPMVHNRYEEVYDDSDGIKLREDDLLSFIKTQAALTEELLIVSG